MEESDKTEKKEEKSNKSHKNSKKVSDDTKIFFISCFHKDLPDEKLIMFYSKETEIESIEYKYSFQLEDMINYIPRVYSIIFRKNEKRPKYLNLSFSFGSTKFCPIKQFSLSNHKRFIFRDIKASEKNIREFINSDNDTSKIKNITKKNYFSGLNQEQKLNIFIHFIEEFCKEKKEKVTEYKENLAYDFLNASQNYLKKINFSNAINLFVFSYNNRNLFQLMDFLSNIIYNKDIVNNNNFIKLLDIYNNNRKSFFEPISKIKDEKKQK